MNSINWARSSSVDEVLEEELPLVLLSWTNLTFTVSTKDEEGLPIQKEILHSVEGYANPGELLVIMGPSGAGKTTLMNLLANRVNIGKTTQLTGEIMANGEDINKLPYENFTAYVMQEDILLDTMTVRECLKFSCDLRTTGDSEKKARKVNRMIDDLLLRKAENSRVGSVLRRGVSGGERKRVCIGVEVITNPSVLFLDEPTSGLDSYTALAIVRLLKKQTRRGRTVITTLHQPSSDIYKLFDKLLVVADGHIIYHGGPYDAITWFERIGYKFPEYGNPADSVMRYVSLKRKDKKTDEEQKNYDIMLGAYKQNKHEIQAGKTTETLLPLPKDVEKQRASFGLQFRCLLKRGIDKVVRDPVQSRSKIGAGIVLGLLCMILFWDLSKSTKGLENREGFFFFSVAIWIVQGLTGVILAFPVQRAVFLKEQTSRMYDILPYFISKQIPELVFEIASVAVFSLTVYWSIGLNTNKDDKFIIFMIVLALCQAAGSSLGFFLGALISDVDAALAIGPALVFPMQIFSGFLVNIASLPAGSSWLQYCSFHKYGFAALIYNEFHQLKMNCEDLTIQELAAGEVECHPIGDLNLTLNMTENICILAAIVVGVRIGAFFALKMQVQKLGS